MFCLLLLLLQASETEIVWVIRGAILGVGIIATVLALIVRSVYLLFVLCSDLVYAILFPQLVCVIYFKSANTYGAICAYVVGLLLRVAGGEPLIGFKPWIEYPYYSETDGQMFQFRTFAMVCSMLTLVAVSYLAQSLFVSREIIPLKYDILKCFGEDEPGAKEQNGFKMAEMNDATSTRNGENHKLVQ